MVTTEPGLRERKKERTKQDLQRVALALIDERGFDEVTTDDIAAAAEVSKTTFYRYFDSKEDVLVGTASEKLALMQTALDARPPDETPMVAVRNAFLVVADLYQNDREQKLAIDRIVRATPSLAARNLQHQAEWEALLREYFGRRAGGIDEGVRPWVLAAGVVGAVRAAVAYWLANDAETDLRALVIDALDQLIAGTSAAAASTTGATSTKGTP